MTMKPSSSSTQILALPQPGGGVRSSRVLEFPKAGAPPKENRELFPDIPAMIREAFLLDLKEGRSNLWGWSYEEVRTALNVYRALREKECQKIAPRTLSSEQS